MIKTSRYWVGLMLPLIVILVGGVIFREFIVDVVSRNPTLNLSIMAAGVIGIYVCLQRGAAFQREVQTLNQFNAVYAKVADPLAAAKKIANRETHMAELLNVLGGLRGQLNNRIEQVSLLRAFEAVKGAYGESLSLPNFLSGFMIAMGLFGTFIGLLETLQNTASFITSITSSNTDGNADKAVMALIEGIEGPLSGMGTSFSASLFGLMGSLILGLMISSLSAFSYRIEHAARRTVDEVVNVEEESAAPVEALSPQQIMQLASQMAIGLDRMTSFSEQFAHQAQSLLSATHMHHDDATKLSETIQRQTDAFIEDMAAARQAQAESQHSLARIHESLHAGVVTVLGELHETVQLQGKERRVQEAQRQVQDAREQEKVEHMLADLSGRLSEVSALQAAHTGEAATMVRAARLAADSVSRLSGAIVTFQSSFEVLLSEVSAQIAETSRPPTDVYVPERRG